MDAAGAWRQPTRPRGRYTRSGTSREDFIVNEERKSRSCAVFALAGGLALIIAGAVIMRRADYGHVKTDLVEAYNKGERRETRKGGSGFHARHPRTTFFPRQQRSDLTTSRHLLPSIHHSSQLSTPGPPSTVTFSTGRRSSSSLGTPRSPPCSPRRPPSWTTPGERVTGTTRWRSKRRLRSTRVDRCLSH